MPILPDPTAIVLDSSALLAYLADEPGGAVVEAVLQAAVRGEVAVMTPSLCLGEALIIAVPSLGPDRIDDFRAALEQLPIEPLTLGLPEALDVALARLAWGLDFAEAAAAVAAQQQSAVLLTTNPQFVSFERSGGWVYWIGPEERRRELTLFDPLARFQTSS